MNKRVFKPWVAHLNMTVYKCLERIAPPKVKTMNFDRSAVSLYKTLHGKVSYNNVAKINRM